jgi:hypothetical protein
MKEKHNSEEEQKLDNQVKKLKIELETGAKFFTPDGSELPADVEAQFLDNIIAFEEASKNSETKTISEILGNPVLIPEEGLTDEQIHEELTKFYKLLDEKSMGFDVIYETPEREIYQFISTEFLAHEYEMMSIPGMMYNFIYEEFVPNEQEDLRKDSEKIIRVIFEQDFEYFYVELAEEINHNGKMLPYKEYIKLLNAMHENRSLELMGLEVTDIAINPDLENAIVTCEIKYSSKFIEEKESLYVDEVIIHFARKFEFWEAKQISISTLGL